MPAVEAPVRPKREAAPESPAAPPAPSATKAPEAPPAPPPAPAWTMPAVEKGDMVYYYRDPGSAPDRGLVSLVGIDHVSLLIIHEHGFVHRAEIHHKNDPAHETRRAVRENGYWSKSK